MKYAIKNSFLTLALAFSLPVYGELNIEQPIEQAQKIGSIYIGVQGGPAIYEGNYTAQKTGGIPETIAFQAGGTSGIIGGCMGVDGRYSFLYGAVEGNVYYDSLDQMIGLLTSPTGIPNHIVKAKNIVLGGVLGKIGFYSGDVVTYLLGGMTAGRWTLGLENDSAINYCRGIQPQSSMFFNHNLTGGKIGAGVRFPMYGDWLFFDMQYSYNWYGDMTISLRDLATDSVWLHRLNDEQHMVLFSLNASLYSF
ncbi:MAG: hypothetical protein ACOYK9_06695 [Chlamydiia bacterium]